MATELLKPPNYYTSHRYEMAKLIPGNVTKVLEIGCGDSNFANFLPVCEYWGIEPSRHVSILSSSNVYKIIRNDYETAYVDLPNNYFDLIVVNDVIEHMQSHDYFFSSIKIKMSSGACILGSVPNVRHISNMIEILIHKDWEYKDSGILDRTHLRFFTQNSLKKILLDHGYIIEILKPINQVLCKRKSYKSFIEQLLCMLLGRDTQFNQIAFRVRKL